MFHKGVLLLFSLYYSFLQYYYKILPVYLKYRQNFINYHPLSKTKTIPFPVQPSNPEVLFQIPADPFLPYTLLHPLKETHDQPKNTEYPAFLSGMLSSLHLLQHRCSQYMIPNYGKGSSSWQYSGHMSCPLQKAQIFAKTFFTSSSNLSFSSSFSNTCLHLHWQVIKRICSPQLSSPLSLILSSAFVSKASICLLSSPVK